MRAVREEDDLVNPSTPDDRYWMGFAAGALIGTAAAVAGFVLTNALSGRSDPRIVRLEDSVQIGRPVEEVFAAWQDIEKLPEHIHIIESVLANGSHSEWLVTVDGKDFRWSAETTQVIPNQSIGWKSVEGPKHSGRLSFSEIGDQTLLHVTMNYAPPLGRLGMLLSPVAGNLEGHISHALRDFKNSLEGNRGARSSEGFRANRVVSPSDPSRADWRPPATSRATGTFGGSPDDADPARSVDYTRPPKPRYP